MGDREHDTEVDAAQDPGEDTSAGTGDGRDQQPDAAEAAETPDMESVNEANASGVNPDA